MPLKTEEIEEPILNLTPMIDIVLLLIIFFMVGTKFSDAERQFEVVLPTVSNASPLSSLPDELVIGIMKNGELLLSGKPITESELQAALTEAHARYENQAVVVRGDANGVYQNVMSVLSICHKVGIRNLSLASRLGEEEGP